MLEPKAIFFGIALSNFVVELVYVRRVQAQFHLQMADEHYWQDAYYYDYLTYELETPFLLLVAATFLLFPRWWTNSITILAGGVVIYERGYIPLLTVSNAFDIPMFSAESFLRLSYGVCGPFAELIFNFLCSAILLTCAAASLSRSVSSGGLLTPNSESQIRVS